MVSDLRRSLRETNLNFTGKRKTYTDEKLPPPEPVNATDFEEKSQLIVEPRSNTDEIENDTMQQSEGDAGLSVAAIAAAMTAILAVVAAATAAKASDSKAKLDQMREQENQEVETQQFQANQLQVQPPRRSRARSKVQP